MNESFYFWMTAAMIFLAAFDVMVGHWIVALGSAIVCLYMGNRRMR